MATVHNRDELVAELIGTIRATHTSNQRLDDVVAEALGINRTDSHCFDILDQHGPMTAGHLATAAGLTSGAVTAVIDRLASRRFVERRDDPQDRRRVLVAITDEGRRRTQAFYVLMNKKAATAFSHLTEAEIELLTDFHRGITVVQDETAEEIIRSRKGPGGTLD